MAWDLRGALLKKQEVESARLADFEFRHRVLTFRLLARALGLEESGIARKAASRGADDLLADIGANQEIEADALRKLHQQLSADARRQLIAQIGDPSPYRLL